MYDFSVDYRIFGAGNIINIHKYSMKKLDKKMFRLTKKKV